MHARVFHRHTLHQYLYTACHWDHHPSAKYACNPLGHQHYLVDLIAMSVEERLPFYFESKWTHPLLLCHYRLSWTFLSHQLILKSSWQTGVLRNRQVQLNTRLALGRPCCLLLCRTASPVDLPDRFCLYRLETRRTWFYRWSKEWRQLLCWDGKSRVWPRVPAISRSDLELARQPLLMYWWLERPWSIFQALNWPSLCSDNTHHYPVPVPWLLMTPKLLPLSCWFRSPNMCRNFCTDSLPSSKIEPKQISLSAQDQFLHLLKCLLPLDYCPEID